MLAWRRPAYHILAQSAPEVADSDYAFLGATRVPFLGKVYAIRTTRVVHCQRGNLILQQHAAAKLLAELIRQSLLWTAMIECATNQVSAYPNPQAIHDGIL